MKTLVVLFALLLSSCTKSMIDMNEISGLSISKELPNAPRIDLPQLKVVMSVAAWEGEDQPADSIAIVFGGSNDVVKAVQQYDDLAVKSGNKLLSVYSHSLPRGTDMIALKTWKYSNGMYTFRFYPDDIKSGYKFYLEDKYGTETAISTTGPTEIYFSVYPPVDDPARFKIKIRKI